ncbi:hypothetical protein yc1106_00614 [Curvularia clavata]|uniref:Uncharacterized protein n=1 Tax=Curvularia clavata TaxID=95742 RepID=A0A9Q8Z1E5_CURCL|nr:hypothetical protein yc1106_00614 [Curvularia clavata]
MTRATRDRRHTLHHDHHDAWANGPLTFVANASHVPPPAPPVATSDRQDYHQHDSFQESPIYLLPEELPHNDEPPPSYDDAVAISGAPPGYGTFTHFPEDSSIASSEVDSSDRALPEWLGQLLVVLIFLGLIYGFWRFVHDDDMPDDGWPHFGPPST